MRHFGTPLVETVFDFGRNGTPPTHPKLLDWLAVELMESGWSMKHLHRLIVTSKTYRLHSTSRALAASSSVANRHSAANNKLDPENRYLWRMTPRRMEAELVRDGVLHVSHALNARMGGPDLDLEQGEKIRRRSLYFSHHDEGRMQLLNLFDVADPCDCYRRTETIVPQQALALANSRLVRQQSRSLASALGSGFSAEAEFIRAAFEQILVRLPSKTETAACHDFLAKQRELYESDEFSKHRPAATARPGIRSDARAREGLVHALLNHNDFVTVR